MFNKSTVYSYRAQQHQRNRIIKIVCIFFIFFILYNCLTAFLFSVWVIDNDTMHPELSSGDMVLFTSFNLNNTFLSKSKIEENLYQFKRGSIVLVDLRRNMENKLLLQFVDTFVRFFTAQKISIFSGSGQYYIKRVIAVPGDEISMQNYIFRVKTPASPYSLTEFELSERPYHPAIPQIPVEWDDSLPFSGNMDTLILGIDEIFVISDDRSNTNDSRTWGAVNSETITAKAVLRFWPVNKIKLF